MGRKKSPQQELETVSRARLKSIFSDWIVNSREDQDFGFDFEVRVTESDGDLFQITPSNLFVQLKASDKFENDDSVYCDIDVDFLVDDCLQSPIPVVLMIYERAEDELYWCILQSRCWDEFDENKPGWRSQQTVRVRIDRSNVISGDVISRSKFQSELAAVEDRISLRKFVSVVNPDKNGRSGIPSTQLAESDSVTAYKKEQLDLAHNLLDSNAESRALLKLLEIYQMPEDDEPRLESILEMLQIRDIDHPVVAFVHDEFASVGMEIAQKINRRDVIDFLQEQKEISENVIRKWLPGARGLNNKVDEEFLVLNVEDWAFDSPNHSVWVAMQQYEDGVLWDENARALVSNDMYELLEFDEKRHPVRDACEDGLHEFKKDELRLDGGPAFCNNCGLSDAVLMEYLNHDVPFVCESCEELTPFSEFTEGYICQSCHA